MRRAILTAVVSLAFPDFSLAQGINLFGVAEGITVVLSLGAATTNLTITATVSGNVGTTNAAFLLERQGSLFASRTSAPPYSVTFSNLPVGKYFLSANLMGGGATPSGDLSFDVAAASLAPTNDNWNKALSLTLNSTVVGTNSYATSETGEPIHAGIGFGRSIWWTWTAVSNGVFTATTAGSSFDTVLGIYRGTNLTALSEVVSSDDAAANGFSQATFFATNGVTYFIAVDSASANGFGRTQLKLLAGAPTAITITSPTDGAIFLVTSPTQPTNATAAAMIVDPAGVARVEYWFDGAGVSRSGMLTSPYQLSLTNLAEGHYVFTVAASNNVGLVSMASGGFSVISLAPKLMLESFAMGKMQLGMTGFKGTNYTILASTNLEAWCSVSNLTNFSGAGKVADTNFAQFNRGFYRAAATP